MSAVGEKAKKPLDIKLLVSRKRVATCQPIKYSPQPMLTKIHLPINRLNRSVVFPRASHVYKQNHPTKEIKHPPRLVNQHNLKEQTKFKLYWPPQKPDFPKDFMFDDDDSKKEALNKIPDLIPWSQLKPDSSMLFHSGLRFERIKTLLSVNLKSSCFDEKKEAIKHIGLLKTADNAVIYSLNNILDEPNENDLIKYECAKTLVSLGCWSDKVCDLLVEYMQNGGLLIQEEILETIKNGKNTQFYEKNSSSFINLIEYLKELSNSDNEKISIGSSVCIGKLGVKECRMALDRLVEVIQTDQDWHKKSLALEALVRLFDAKDSQTISYILNQIEYSTNWISRSSALKLLSYLGTSIVCRSEHLETIYRLLENRLSDDPIREVRLDVGTTMKDLQLFDRVFSRMSKNLESHDDEVRAKAVIAIEMLGVKKSKIIHTLIDMLELDSSENVRTLVIKALYFLAPNNPRVMLALNALEKNSKIYQVLVKLKEQEEKLKQKHVKILN